MTHKRSVPYKKKEEEDKDFFDDSCGEVFKRYTKATKSTHDIFLSDSIESEVPEYFELLHFLSTVSASDTVKVHLMNYGGDCKVGLNLCHCFRNCSAHVIMEVDAPSYSMGAILALSGHELKMKPGTFLMFHNYSGGRSGKGAELVKSVLESQRWLHDSFTYFCRPFLTASEMNKIKKDEDVYIQASNSLMDKRIARHFNKKG